MFKVIYNKERVYKGQCARVQRGRGKRYGLYGLHGILHIFQRLNLARYKSPLRASGLVAVEIAAISTATCIIAAISIRQNKKKPPQRFQFDEWDALRLIFRVNRTKPFCSSCTSALPVGHYSSCPVPELFCRPRQLLRHGGYIQAGASPFSSLQRLSCTGTLLAPPPINHGYLPPPFHAHSLTRCGVHPNIREISDHPSKIPNHHRGIHVPHIRKHWHVDNCERLHI